MNFLESKERNYNGIKDREIIFPFEKDWNSYLGKVKNEKPMFYLVLGYVGDKMCRKIGNLLKKCGFNFLYLPELNDVGEIKIGFYGEDNFMNFIKLGELFRKFYDSLERNNSGNVLYKKLAEEYPKLSNK